MSPTDANWNTRLRSPSVVRPTTTACGPMRLPAPMRTAEPMIENGPISTSSARRAPGSTSAVGWTAATSDDGKRRRRRRVADRGQERRLTDELLADARAGAKAPDVAHRALELGFEEQRVARNHLALEACLVDSGEEDELAAILPRGVGEHRQEPGRL